MIYTASLDKMSKIITGFFIAGTAILLVTNVFTANWENTFLNISIANILLVVIFFSTFVICWLYAPRNYEINSEQLIIHRKIGGKEFKLDDIETAELLKDEAVKGMIRTFGVGGLFGYFGKFYHTKYGRLKVFMTQRKNPVLIVFKDASKILISPDQTELIKQLNSMK